MKKGMLRKSLLFVGDVIWIVAGIHALFIAIKVLIII
jgi:hypothetical protein